MTCFRLKETDGETAKARERLIGALVGLARAAEGIEEQLTPETDRLVVESLIAALSDENIPPDTVQVLAERVHAEKGRLAPNCAVCTSCCGRTADYDMQNVWEAEEEIRAPKIRILFALRDMAKAWKGSREVSRFFFYALSVIGLDLSPEILRTAAESAEALCTQASADVQKKDSL